uniref:Uncharacterized protein n=1 Tax=Anguilla anguilla TaxID=7936 RepID=A0A0E9RAJ2_ANGAN
MLGEQTAFACHCHYYLHHLPSVPNTPYLGVNTRSVSHNTALQGHFKRVVKHYKCLYVQFFS